LKKIIILLLTVVATAHARPAAELPRVQLIREYQVSDTAGPFFFRHPGNPVFGPQGELILRDQRQLLIFDSGRRFIANLYQPGEGPGELQGIIGIWPGAGRFRVFNSAPGKMVIFDYRGNHIREVYYPKPLYKSRLLSRVEGRYFFTEEEYRNPASGEKTIDTRVRIFSLDEQGHFLGYLDSGFTKKYFLGPATIMNLNFIQTGTADHRNIFLAHSGLYELKHLDLSADTITSLFSREYPKVKIRNEWRRYTHPTSYRTRRRYFRHTLDDILRIRVLDDKIWLFTSTWIDGQGLRVDVVSTRGESLGSFAFPLPGGIHHSVLSHAPLTFHGHRLWVFEQDESGSLVLNGYRLSNIPPWAR